MPAKKQRDGTHRQLAYPTNAERRNMIQREYGKIVGKRDPVPSAVSASERLRALEQIKNDGLINEEEYKHQAKGDSGRNLGAQNRVRRSTKRYPTRPNANLTAQKSVVTRSYRRIRFRETKGPTLSFELTNPEVFSFRRFPGGGSLTGGSSVGGCLTGGLGWSSSGCGLGGFFSSVIIVTLILTQI
jgi:hypothetical protein